MECKFCKKQLSTVGNLNYHIKNNKNCLEIQKNQDQNDNNNLVSCDFCKKSFSNKTLKVHLKSCKNKIIKEKDDIIEEMKKEKDDIIEEMKKEKDDIIEEKDNILKEKDDIIEEMKNRILKLETENDIYKNDHDFVKNLASQPKTTTNNKIRVMNNFFDNPEKVKQLVNDKLTQNHICDGQKGVAQFAINFLLKDDEGNVNYFCTDPSRSIFKFQNSDGETEKDIKAMKLTNMLIDAGLKHKTGTIAPTLWTKKDGTVDADKFQIFSPSTNEIILMQTDNSVFRNELACMTSV
jgi:sugar-specific transcriptional regulator TrmB